MPATISRGRGRRTISEINMVPFIDVMLVLLIIFMVTAPLIAPSMIKIPSVGQGAQTPKQIVEIVVRTDDSLEFKRDGKGVPIELGEIADAAIKAQTGVGDGDSVVIISADRNVKYESVVKIMDTLNRAGVKRVGLAVQVAK